MIHKIFTSTYLPILFFILPIKGFANPNTENSSWLIQEMHRVYNEAEQAMKQRNFFTAKKSYQDLLALAASDDQLIDHDLQVDIQFRLATAVSQLGHYREAEQILSQIINEDIPSHLFVGIQLLRSEGFKKMNRLETAYHILVELNQNSPMHTWPAESRLLFLELQTRAIKYYDTMLIDAEALFKKKKITQALELFKQLYLAASKNYFPSEIGEEDSSIVLTNKLTVRLAQCFYLLKQWENVIQVMSLIDEEALKLAETENLLMIGFRLQGLSYANLNQTEKAIIAYKQCLTFDRKGELSNDPEFLWQLASYSFNSHKLSESEKLIQHTLNLPGISRSYIDKNLLLLARIYISQEKTSEAELLFQQIEEHLSPESLLTFEVAFLKGEIAYQQKSYLEATEYFSIAIPHHNKTQARWYPNTLLRLGNAFLKIVQYIDLSYSEKENFLYKAEDSFKELLNYSLSEQATLGLAEVYAIKKEELKDPRSEDLTQKLFKQYPPSSKEGQASGLLLQARSSNSSEKKHTLYKKALNDKYSDTTAYPLAYYYYGLFLLQDIDHVKTGIQNLEQAAQLLLQRKSYFFAANAMETLSNAYWSQNNTSSKKSAVSILNKICTEYPQLLAQISHPDELLFRKALWTLKSYQTSNDTNSLAQAETDLRQLLLNYPMTKYRAETLHLMGTISYRRQRYAKAEQIFAKLGKEFPEHELAHEAWYWAIKAAEYQIYRKEEEQKYRKILIENYPNSPHADESYFHYFCIDDYIQGNELAIAHLTQLTIAYPKSLYLLPGYYCLAHSYLKNNQQLKNSDPTQAIEYFQKAIEIYELYETEFLSSQLENWEQFFILSIKDLANTYLEESKISHGPKSNLYLQFATQTYEKLLTTLNATNSTHIPLIKEALFTLTTNYLSDCNFEEADTNADSLLKQIKENPSQDSDQYLISYTYFLKSKIAINQKNYTKAAFCIQKAEAYGIRDYLNTEEVYELEDYKERGNPKQAML